jgi:hypothetical protein
VTRPPHGGKERARRSRSQRAAGSLSWFFDAHLEWLAWTEFSIQGLLSHAVLIFIFTFKATRLI